MNKIYPWYDMELCQTSFVMLPFLTASSIKIHLHYYESEISHECRIKLQSCLHFNVIVKQTSESQFLFSIEILFAVQGKSQLLESA
jgi:hypothetical protein